MNILPWLVAHRQWAVYGGLAYQCLVAVTPVFAAYPEVSKWLAIATMALYTVGKILDILNGGDKPVAMRRWW